MRTFCIYPRKDDSTSWYRGAGVFGELVREGVEIDGSTQISWVELVGQDVVFFQRPFLQTHKNVANIIKSNNKPLVLDYDDLLVGIPDDNHFKRRYKDEPYEATYAELLNLADGVILSTEYMKQYLQEQKILNHNRVKVIRNAFNDFAFNFNYNFSDYNKTVLWRGTITHVVDFEGYETALKNVVRENPDFSFMFVGYCPEFLMKKPNVFYIPPTDVILFMQKLKALKPSLVFTPLKDIPFNRAKSNIAKIEGTYAGAVSLSMNWDEWKWNDNPDYYFENPEELYKKMSLGIKAVRDKNPAIEEEYQKNFEYIKQNLLLSEVNKQRVEFLKEVWSGYIAGKNASL